MYNDHYIEIHILFSMFVNKLPINYREIINYCNRYSILKVDVKLYINKLRSNNFIDYSNKKYNLNHNGHKYVRKSLDKHANVIINAFKRYLLNRGESLKIRKIKRRENQEKLRKHLLANNEHKCFFCGSKKPEFNLEAAHIKPYCRSSSDEVYDNNIVVLACLDCHRNYDKGLFTIKNSKLLCSDKYITVLSEYDVKKPKENFELNDAQKSYFNYHYNKIYDKIE
jgi:hypothetical protein